MIHKLLESKRVVLASSSPRRKLLFEMLGIKPIIIPSKTFEEVSLKPTHLQVMEHASNKAIAVAALMDNDVIVVGADTLVCLNRQVLGKPTNRDEARDYLKSLSGHTHSVYTGVSIVWRNQSLTKYEKSAVEFKPLTDREIEDYLETKEPFDKAGAYGIQGYGSQFIKGIRGCYFNVMGFPIYLFYNMMIQLTAEHN